MFTYQLATNQDIPGVLNLQEQNLASNLTEEERKRGFVTTPFTEAQLREIISLNGLYIAKNQQKIIAYLFAGSWDYFSQWEIFNLMVSRFRHLSFQDQSITTQNSFQYGPVCIDIQYRGLGHFNQLFEIMRLAYVRKYPISVTFINKVNQISTAAHTRKLGWQIIDEFQFNNQEYYGLALDMSQSVLTQK